MVDMDAGFTPASPGVDGTTAFLPQPLHYFETNQRRGSLLGGAARGEWAPTNRCRAIRNATERGPPEVAQLCGWSAWLCRPSVAQVQKRGKLMFEPHAGGSKKLVKGLEQRQDRPEWTVDGRGCGGARRFQGRSDPATVRATRGSRSPRGLSRCSGPGGRECPEGLWENQGHQWWSLSRAYGVPIRGRRPGAADPQP